MKYRSSLEFFGKNRVILLILYFSNSILAYSVQVYEFITGKKPNEIKSILNKIYQDKSEARSRHNITLKEIKVENGLVHISMTHDTELDSNHFDITLKPDDNFLIVQGTSMGRKAVNGFLSFAIEQKRMDQVVTDHTLPIKQMIKLFNNIVAQSKNNIIEELIIFFEPSLGYEYNKEQYTKLSYKFVTNRCASKHADFQKFCKDGKRFDMKMKIEQCVGISDQIINDGMKLEVKSVCTFRAYKDIPQNDWDKFCFYVLDFL